MVRFYDKPTRVGDTHKDYRSPHELVCSETPNSASAGRPNYWHAKRQRRGPWPAARMPMLQAAPRHELLLHRTIPDSCARRGRAERRTGGPDRRLKGQFRSTPSATVPDHGQRSQQKHTHNSKRTPRPAATAPSHPPFPPAALPQDVPDEADAREEDGPEPAHPPVDPHAHGQQDPLELEAAALAPHEARPLSRVPKNVFV